MENAVRVVKIAITPRNRHRATWLVGAFEVKARLNENIVSIIEGQHELVNLYNGFLLLRLMREEEKEDSTLFLTVPVGGNLNFLENRQFSNAPNRGSGLLASSGHRQLGSSGAVSMIKCIEEWKHKRMCLCACPRGSTANDWSLLMGIGAMRLGAPANKPPS